MSNMGYCKFRNTLGDLRDCYDDLAERNGLDGKDEYEHVLEGEELAAAIQLIKLCNTLSEEYGESLLEQVRRQKEVCYEQSAGRSNR